ncbi:hypothetical protein E2C01_074487 [Portunus trituberculatus]|uniref:Uncharacterized protein n=1 Tax=Portunus trituberculatus TaxID=210409 RepID=A0A5B7I5S4_PORTR|nr:hypothetical protein [Portunus trituberculatus]
MLREFHLSPAARQGRCGGLPGDSSGKFERGHAEVKLSGEAALSRAPPGQSVTVAAAWRCGRRLTSPPEESIENCTVHKCDALECQAATGLLLKVRAAGRRGVRCGGCGDGSPAHQLRHPPPPSLSSPDLSRNGCMLKKIKKILVSSVCYLGA